MEAITKICNQNAFCNAAPTAQNAVDIFDNWTSTLPIANVNSGGVALFDREKNPHVQNCRECFGSLEGWSILELGSLEGANTYLMTKFGPASIVAIEANPISYLKSLVAKELLDFDAKFLYGDFNSYMRETEQRFDMVFATGVLYHMPDPVNLLYLVSNITDRLYIWSMYVSDKMARTSKTNEVIRHGYKCNYIPYFYPTGPGREYSGIQVSCNLLTKHDIIGALGHFGFDKVRIVRDELEAGPTIELAASRTVRTETPRESEKSTVAPRAPVCQGS
jgi:hypothetical protein